MTKHPSETCSTGMASRRHGALLSHLAGGLWTALVLSTTLISVHAAAAPAWQASSAIAASIPLSDCRGVEGSVMTMVNLLAKRLARAEVTPIGSFISSCIVSGTRPSNR